MTSAEAEDKRIKVGSDEWTLQVYPLIEAIAEWERVNGTAASLVGQEEFQEIAMIVNKWATYYSARSLA